MEVDIGIEEDLKLFQVLNSGEVPRISFWSRHGNSKDYVHENAILNRNLTVKIQSDNAHVPSESFTLPIKDILQANTIQSPADDKDKDIDPILDHLSNQQKISDVSEDNIKKEMFSFPEHTPTNDLLRNFVISQDITDLYRATKSAIPPHSLSSQNKDASQMLKQIEKALKVKQTIMTYWLIENIVSVRPAINRISSSLYPILCNLLSITLDNFITASGKDIALLAALNDVSRGQINRETFLNMCKSSFLPFSASEPLGGDELTSPNPMLSNIEGEKK